MDAYEVESLIARLEIRNADAQAILALFAETLSHASDRLTDDEIRRFLLCGAYFLHQHDQSPNTIVVDSDPPLRRHH